MNTIRIVIGLIWCAATASAEPDANRVLAAAHTSFADMPRVEVVETIAGRCGADHTVNPVVAYCASTNTVYAAGASLFEPDMPYQLGHVLGHAAQIRHGVADVALAAIRADRAAEPTLRKHVTQQVDCLAGVFYARAGLPRASLLDWYDTEPFTGAHWGRNPLTVGPKVSIGLAQRDQWFQRGQSGKVADCTVAVFGADLLIAADRF